MVSKFFLQSNHQIHKDSDIHACAYLLDKQIFRQSFVTALNDEEGVAKVLQKVLE